MHTGCPPSPSHAEVKQPRGEVDHLRSGPSLRKGGDTHLLTLFAFIAFAGTTLPLLVALACLGLRVCTGCPLSTVLLGGALAKEMFNLI